MKKKMIKLRYAIGSLLIFTILCTIIINWVSSSHALRDSLTKNYLENNEKYAKKLASSTNELMTHMQGNMNTMANLASKEEVNDAKLEHWRAANNHYFNSLFITDQNGVIQSISPSIVQFKETVQIGTKIESETMKKALSLKKPFISNPYIATSGQLILLVSSPIFGENGEYKGLIGGTIYLKSNNALYNMLSNHAEVDRSYVYVVDNSGRIVFHPDKRRINDLVSENPIVKEVMKGNSGSSTTTNTQGKQFMAGYAYEEATGWGVVSQTPIEALNQPLRDLYKEMLIRSFPLLAIILIIAWLLSHNLSRPLNTLAKYTEEALSQRKSTMLFKNLKSYSNIYEIRQLYEHFNRYVNLLNRQIQQDGLTGLANRRTFDQEINRLFSRKIPFTIIMIDIDHFKKVNDAFGHLAGDDVLKYLAKLIAMGADTGDLCFRYGGEEFGILLKRKSELEAYKMAENLRKKVAETLSPIGKPITISLGISSYRKEDLRPEDAIQRADKALYLSKLKGRNLTTIYAEKEVS